jgi:hypothetical protein
VPTDLREAAAARIRAIMHLGFDRALRKSPDRLHELLYCFGGYPVRVRIVGHEIAKDIIQPFSHLQDIASNMGISRAQLTIDIWDENETGVRCGINTRNGSGGRPKFTLQSPDGRFIARQRASSFSCYDREAKRIIGVAAWSDQVSVYERGKPLDRPLLQWHNDHDLQAIHAGLVSWKEKGVLFVGKSGSGKSTSALACFMAGFHFLSEDVVGLQSFSNGSFLGHSIYNSVFLKTDHLRRFPSMHPHVATSMSSEDKSFLLLSQIFPERLARSVPIRAIVCPRVVDTLKPKLWPASKGDALLALAPSSLLELPNRGLGNRGFQRLVQLIQKVPCYWLEVGRELDRIPNYVRALLKELD